MTPATDAAPYPRHWEADVVASDGGIVHLRPIVPSDAEALLRFHQSLSERTRYLRYFGPYPRIPPRDLERFTHVDHRTRVAFICLLGDEIIAVGRYEGLMPDDAEPGAPVESAEVAFVVRDEHQGRGLGSILLEHLAAAARESGMRRFEAEVLVENHQMVRVFRDAGYQVAREFAEGVLHLEFDVDPTERSLAVRDAREQRAEARSVHNVLHPRSVAVIGASTDPTKIGHAVLAHLLRANFTGPVYPVNPDARSVRGVRAYPTVTEIPDDVDLAVVAVPASGIDEVMDSCLAKGVKALVVISSGFADAGEGGTGAERRLVNEARAHGMRVIGPNALGVANTAPQVRLNATLAPDLPGGGRVGFFCQSGALGIAILAAARERGLGFSTFVSAGNRADLSGNDLLQYWQTDPATDVVLLYLETFGNPRKFARLARRLARTKPIVAVKSGRHSKPTAALAPSSSAIDEVSVRALFEQAGVIRVETLADLFDVAQLLAYQPLPSGPRVAVVGNSSALGLLASDALLGEGLELVGDAVDVGVAAPPEVFAAAVAKAVGDERVDALVAVFVPPVAIPGAAYARALREAVAGAQKPVVAVFLAVEGVPAELAAASRDGTPGPGSVPSYAGPERAAAALARVSRYARWRARPVGEFVTPAGIEPERARELVQRLGAEAPRALPDTEVHELLACYGIEVGPSEAAGVSCVLEIVDDPSFGSLLSFGLSGMATELLGDRAFRVVPVSDQDAAALVRAPRAAPLLAGYGGTEPTRLDALEELVLRVGRIADDLPQVRSLSLDPVLASSEGVFVTSARVVLGPPPQRGDTGPRQLR
jgi:acyl-CoA synthetase (NDP forming)/RimJ/RimL family protein N-acetyltransferase